MSCQRGPRAASAMGAAGRARHKLGAPLFCCPGWPCARRADAG
jgi:hypothetical protein